MATKEEVLAALNDEQKQAVVDYDGSMVVEAGPGSVKPIRLYLAASI